ncbi:MTA, partial [Symbiodinium sp. CCMP2456]
AGHEVARRRVVALLRHHGTNPELRSSLRLRMGRGKKWQQAGADAGQGSVPWRGQYWSGAWSPSLQTHRSAGSYDRVTVPVDTAPPAGLDSAMPGDSRGMTELHKTVTYARKLDTKVRKLGEERLRRTKQWEIFAKEAKAKFLKQRREFEQDLQRIDQEVREAVDAGREAAEKAKTIVTRGVDAVIPRKAPMAVDHWGELFREEEGDPPGELLSQVLAAANHAATGGRLGQVRPEILQQLASLIGVEAHPGVFGAPEMPPDTRLPDSSHATYFGPHSPNSAELGGLNHGVAETRASPLHPKQRDPNQARVPPAEHPPRKGIKAATRLPPQPVVHPRAASPADKIERSREEEMKKALLPFGGVPRPKPSPFEEDDDDLDVPESGGGTASGLQALS